jgi:hypothetical protein
MNSKTVVLALALVASGCAWSVEVLPRSKRSVDETAAANADRLQRDLVEKVRKLLKSGETEARILEMLQAAGQSEADAARLVALAKLG